MREGEAPQARVSRIGLLPHFARSCVAVSGVLPLALRMRLIASPVEPAHDPGRFRCVLTEMRAMVCGTLCVLDVVWNAGVERVCLTGGRITVWPRPRFCQIGFQNTLGLPIKIVEQMFKIL